MIRKFGWALAAAASIVGFGSASAADMAVKARPVVVPIYNWTGCYVGLSAGGKGVATRDTVFIPATAFSPAASFDGGRLDDATWIAGGQIGCNYQSGRWVFGIEGDAHAQRWSTGFITTGPGRLPPFVDGDNFALHSDWQASVRGRVGYAQDRTLFYVSGGAAFTGVRANSNWIQDGIFPAVIASQTKTLVGGTVGVGVEHAVTDNFTLGLEGRYSWYGNQRFDAGVVPTAVIPAAALVFANAATYRDVRVETGEVIFKANWKFGPTGAVVAKY
jgi:outer membrane immunogenic protein